MKKLIYTVILASAFLRGCSCGGDDEISKNNVNDSEAISMETSGVDMTTEGTSDLLNDATTGKNEQQTKDKNTEDDSSLNQGTSENRYTLDMWLTLASINGYTFGNCYENNNDIYQNKNKKFWIAIDEEDNIIGTVLIYANANINTIKHSTTAINT